MKSIQILLAISFTLAMTSCGTAPNYLRESYSFHRTLWKITPQYYILKSELKNEIRFVQNLMDNPENIREIIETSEYYYEGFSRINYDAIIECAIMSPKIVDFGKPYVVTRYSHEINMKMERPFNRPDLDCYRVYWYTSQVTVRCNHRTYYFTFAELGNRMLLLDVITYSLH
jgi:hypothetical protein